MVCVDDNSFSEKSALDENYDRNATTVTPFNPFFVLIKDKNLVVALVDLVVVLVGAKDYYVVQTNVVSIDQAKDLFQTIKSVSLVEASTYAVVVGLARVVVAN